jgi:phage terminase small subunit
MAQGNRPIDPETGLQKLNKRQQMFVDAYVGMFSIEKAARAAGYPVKSAYQAGKKTYNLPHVRAAIEAKKKDYLEDLGFSKERLIVELCKQAYADIKNFAGWNTEWNEELQRYIHHVNVIDSDKIDTSVIKTVKISQRGKVELEMYDKQNAIEKLIKIIGLNAADKVELTGANGGAIQVEDLRTKLIDRITKLAGQAESGTENTGDADSNG